MTYELRKVRVVAIERALHEQEERRLERERWLASLREFLWKNGGSAIAKAEPETLLRRQPPARVPEHCIAAGDGSVYARCVISCGGEK